MTYPRTGSVYDNADDFDPRRQPEHFSDPPSLPRLKVKRIGSHDLPLPAYAKEGDSGMDLPACINVGDPAEPAYPGIHLWRIPAGARVLVPCGFAIEIPFGHEGQIRPRSGMAKKGLVAMLGTIDRGYRGELIVNLVNIGPTEAEIAHGDRVAQLVICPVAHCEVVEAVELSETARGANGWGSTGR